ncbi:hypothetical protein CLOM_g22282 [Closterium sp. NIES-68]|nr:hypothetical protein CLOM_g22282 [Closterium sp. NIES-68]GJP64447.1 hypothetical protein CLOP_g21436 [Closterium sp. NIES-67]
MSHVRDPDSPSTARLNPSGVASDADFVSCPFGIEDGQCFDDSSSGSSGSGSGSGSGGGSNRIRSSRRSSGSSSGDRIHSLNVDSTPVRLNSIRDDTVTITLDPVTITPDSVTSDCCGSKGGCRSDCSTVVLRPKSVEDPAIVAISGYPDISPASVGVGSELCRRLSVLLVLFLGWSLVVAVSFVTLPPIASVRVAMQSPESPATPFGGVAANGSELGDVNGNGFMRNGNFPGSFNSSSSGSSPSNGTLGVDPSGQHYPINSNSNSSSSSSGGDSVSLFAPDNPLFNASASESNPYPPFSPSSNSNVTGVAYASLHIPHSIADLQSMRSTLNLYMTAYPTRVYFTFVNFYLYIQTFLVPGTLLCNILAGSLFGFPLGLVTISLFITIGACLSYAVSLLILRDVVYYYFTERCDWLRGEVQRHQSCLVYYIIFLRITPVLPSWVINLCAPVVGIPFPTFVIGTFLGFFPYNVVQVKAGCVLSTINSVTDLYDPATIAIFCLLALLTLIPILAKTKFAKRMWDRITHRGGKAGMEEEQMTVEGEGLKDDGSRGPYTH